MPGYSTPRVHYRVAAVMQLPEKRIFRNGVQAHATFYFPHGTIVPVKPIHIYNIIFV